MAAVFFGAAFLAAGLVVVPASERAAVEGDVDRLPRPAGPDVPMPLRSSVIA